MCFFFYNSFSLLSPLVFRVLGPWFLSFYGNLRLFWASALSSINWPSPLFTDTKQTGLASCYIWLRFSSRFVHYFVHCTAVFCAVHSVICWFDSTYNTQLGLAFSLPRLLELHTTGFFFFFTIIIILFAFLTRKHFDPHPPPQKKKVEAREGSRTSKRIIDLIEFA